MPNTIQIKRSSTASATPTAGQLSAGELAINTADGKLFAKNTADEIINLPVTSISGQDITPNTVEATDFFVNSLVANGVGANPYIAFQDDNASPGFELDGTNGLTIYTTSGSTEPGGSTSFFSVDRFNGRLTVHRLAATETVSSKVGVGTSPTFECDVLGRGRFSLQLTGNLTAGSTDITNLPSTSGIVPGTFARVTIFSGGGNVTLTNAAVSQILSTTSVRMNVAAGGTGSATGAVLVFSGPALTVRGQDLVVGGQAASARIGGYCWFGKNNGTIGVGAIDNATGTFSSTAPFMGFQGLNEGATAYNSFCFTAGNFAQLFLDTSGNVGVNTATPTTARLVVRGAGATSATTALNVIDSSNVAMLTARNDGLITVGKGQLTCTRAGSATTANGQIYLNGTTSNRIDFNASGTAAPAFTTRSAGTKIVFNPTLSGTAVDYGIGCDTTSLWQSIPQATNGFDFRWFGGTTQLASLNGAGTLTVSGDTIVQGVLTAVRAPLRQTAAPAISSNALTLDLSTAAVFLVSLNANITTLTISNVPTTANRAVDFTVIFTADGTARTITWPASVKWAGGTGPTMTSTNGKQDVIDFTSTDAGATWLAHIRGQNY